jgi:nucleoside-diphosphate-sugar epimerase
MTIKVLLTGANGLIGSEIAYLLPSVGLVPITPQRSHVDLTRPNSLKALGTESFRAVVHCAAILPGKNPILTEQEEARANRLMDEQVVDFCQNHGLPLVYLSSLAVYGPPKGVTLDEKAPLELSSPYIEAKVFSEQLITQNLEAWVILRLGAPYGPAMTARTVLKIFMDNALSGKDLTYHGSGNREQMFIHVTDVAKAVLASLKALMPEDLGGDRALTNQGRIFNISGGQVVSMKELAQTIILLTGSDSRIIPSGQPDPQEFFRPRFSLQAAKEILGWRPSISLEEGLSDWVNKIKA